ncbi:MAG: PspA/IM30 family protein [Cyanobacteriota bacterium]|nr:PspA/IM30 family protein [Cyanobacteriota bacterium]
MLLLDRVSRVLRANLNDIVSKAEDPEKVLEQAIIDMGEDLVKLREAVVLAIASQKRSQQQYEQSKSQVNQWLSKAQLALQKGEESLAREALQRKKTAEEQANLIKVTLDQQIAQVDTLRRNLTQLESKISEAKTQKNMLKARAQAAKANEKLGRVLDNINTTSPVAVLERMEEKVLQMEARSKAQAELTGSDLDSQFKALEAGHDVDDELAALKAEMQLGPAPNAGLLSASETSTPETDARKPEVDIELEDLRQQLHKA